MPKSSMWRKLFINPLPGDVNGAYALIAKERLEW